MIIIKILWRKIGVNHEPFKKVSNNLTCHQTHIHMCIIKNG